MYIIFAGDNAISFQLKLILVFALVFLVDIVPQGAKQVTGVCVLSKVLFKAGPYLAVTHHCDSGLCNCSLAEA